LSKKEIFGKVKSGKTNILKEDNKMRKFMRWSTQLFMGATFLIGALISSGACQGTYYQPEVPEKLRSKE